WSRALRAVRLPTFDARKSGARKGVLCLVGCSRHVDAKESRHDHAMTTPLHDIVEHAPDLVPATRAKYARDLNQWVAFAGVDPNGWTRARAQEFYQSLLERGLQVQSANRVMASIRYASKWWAHREMRPELDFGVVRLAKEHVEKKRHALSREQAELL